MICISYDSKADFLLSVLQGSGKHIKWWTQLLSEKDTGEAVSFGESWGGEEEFTDKQWVPQHKVEGVGRGAVGGRRVNWRTTVEWERPRFEFWFPHLIPMRLGMLHHLYEL